MSTVATARAVTELEHALEQILAEARLAIRREAADRDDVAQGLRDQAGALGTLVPAVDGAASIDRIAALESLIRAASGALAAEEAGFAERQRCDQLARGVRQRDLGRGIAEQIAFARGISPTSAARHLGYAQALSARLPGTCAELRAGRVSEQQARIAVTRTSHLSDADAGIVDAAIAPRLSGWNVRATEQAVDHAAYAIDPRGSVERSAVAEKDRRVWIRPAPDCMAIVSALLPMAQGVAVHTGLRAAAQTLQGTGEAGGRGLGQVMADLLVTRCTGQSSAAAVPMEIRVTIPADALLGNGSAPAWVDGYGPAPASSVRALACYGMPADARIWLRRLVTDPAEGTVTAVDSRRRLFPSALRMHIMLRDRDCRQPFCTAPIREIDHVEQYASGGRTTLANGQGLCSRGNKLKDLPGWKTRRRGDGSTEVTTPTGHSYLREPQVAAGLPALTRRL